MSLLYFAYGSNLLPARIRQRVAHASLKTTARLEGYALRFDKDGRDGSAKCNIAATDAAEAAAMGAVYELSVADARVLDGFEDLGRGYERTQVTVTADGARLGAYTYIALPQAVDETLRPYTWYHAFVLAGARYHGFPADYIRRLQDVECIDDPDARREQENRAILAAAAEPAANAR